MGVMGSGRKAEHGLDGEVAVVSQLELNAN